MFNNVMLIGRITKNIELRYTQSNRACANFSIAVNRPYKNGEERQADFINIVSWGNLAENLNKYTSKGSLVGVEGRLQTRTYEASDCKKRAITEVLANNIQFLEPKKEKTEEKVNDPFKEFGDRINNGLPEEENYPW
jgi:single-strand DNA-binding protein